MKNRFLYIALSLISVLTSCKDDEFEPLNNVAECTWHVSTDQENVSPIQLNLNNYISIMDLSQGMLSHQWVVSDDGTKFLNGKMEWGQTDYTNLIDESIPHTNDLKTIHVYFTKPGDHTVRLCNTFRRQVVYPYSVYDDNTGGYIKKYCYAKQEGDVYVMDTTFHIRVYDPNLVPAVKVYSDPECTQEIKTGIVGGTEEAPEYEKYELEYGKSVYIKDDSYGLPNKWTFKCADTGVNDELTSFDTPYQFTAKKFSDKLLLLSMTIERTSASEGKGKYTPKASPKTLVVPLAITVVPSDDPITYNIRQIDQTHIAIDLDNSEFGYKEINPSSLKLTYSNSYNRPSAVRGSVNITAAEVNKQSRYELILTLVEKIYNTDELTLTGTLTEALVGNQNLEIKATAPNVATTFGAFLDEDFENPDTYADWKVIDADTKTHPVVPSQVVDNPLKDGINNSAKCMFVEAFDRCRALLSKTFTGGKGTYTFSYKYYTPGYKQGKGMSPYFVPAGKEGAEDMTWQSNKPWCGIVNGSDSKWMSATTTVTSKAEMDNILLSMRFNAFKDNIYFDDIFFGYIEVRP